ncbi:uncharacterized protein [Dysidea avara]|uniref:uncharacterized protein isoform X1 n=1 Tax=Dysidea avara TaxID=196820 RepID=UPI00331E4E7B
MLPIILLGLILGAEALSVEEMLELGGKRFQELKQDKSLPLRDHDYLRLQFLGAKDAWLGCPDSDDKVCDLRRCPSVNQNYRYPGRCWGEEFQIISAGVNFIPIKSGQQIRLRYASENNTWMGCPFNKRCDKRTCPGTTEEGKEFVMGKSARFAGEAFYIYARGKANGAVIYNGDVVMLYYPHEGLYVSIQGENELDNTSIDFCPGAAPPAYLSYAMCSKNSFRVYQYTD